LGTKPEQKIPPVDRGAIFVKNFRWNVGGGQYGPPPWNSHK